MKKIDFCYECLCVTNEDIELAQTTMRDGFYFNDPFKDLELIPLPLNIDLEEMAKESEAMEFVPLPLGEDTKQDSHTS